MNHFQSFHIPPRLMAIHDISGFGRTSLTLVIPILSSMGIQVCPLPTAVLSTHTTEFTDFTFCDLTPELPKILDHWQQLNLKFDAIYSGFLANHEQVEIVERAIKDFRNENALSVVDPVMGDNGVLDPTITPDIVEAMRTLTAKADIITPNFSEVCFLLGEETQERKLDEVKKLAKYLASRGPKIVVITSIPTPDNSYVLLLAYEKKYDRFHIIKRPYIPAFYPGTGDTFASVFTGCMLKNYSVKDALNHAVHFVTNAIATTYESQAIPREGIHFEKIICNER